MQGASLEEIQTRLGAFTTDELITLALDFEESPMRYFSKEDLLDFGYPKRHYVGQLAFAFYENVHTLKVLEAYEEKTAKKRQEGESGSKLSLAVPSDSKRDSARPLSKQSRSSGGDSSSNARSIKNQSALDKNAAASASDPEKKLQGALQKQMTLNSANQSAAQYISTNASSKDMTSNVSVNMKFTASVNQKIVPFDNAIFLDCQTVNYS